MTSRLTPVQRDVIERMKAGATICDDNGMWTTCELRKKGEPSRHVANVTLASLRDRGLIKPSKSKLCWVLA